MNKTRLALAVVAPLLATPAFAHHPGGVGNSQASGPINTLSASTLPSGAFVAGVQYEQTNLDTLSDAVLADAAVDAFLAGEDEHFHSVATIRTVAATLAYGVTDDLTISLRVPFVARENIREGHAHDVPPVEGEVHRLGNPSGLGDVTVLGHLRVLKEAGVELAVLFGAEVPTGDTGKRNVEDGELFDTEFQPGSDSWDVLLGGAVSKRVQRWSFDASGLYTIAGEASNGVDLGDRFNYGVAASYRVIGMQAHDHAPGTRAHSDGNALDLVLELNGEWHGKEVEAGETEASSGGHALYLAPGARFTADTFSAFVSVGIPVTETHNGLQDEPQLRLETGVTTRF
jgi:hypothetical protein